MSFYIQGMLIFAFLLFVFSIIIIVVTTFRSRVINNIYEYANSLELPELERDILIKLESNKLAINDLKALFVDLTEKDLKLALKKFIDNNYIARVNNSYSLVKHGFLAYKRDELSEWENQLILSFWRESEVFSYAQLKKKYVRNTREEFDNALKRLLNNKVIEIIDDKYYMINAYQLKKEVKLKRNSQKS